MEGHLGSIPTKLLKEENSVIHTNSFLKRLMVAGVAISSLLWSGAAPAAQTSSTPAKFISREGGFAARMQGIPKETSEAMTSDIGPTTLHLFVVERSDRKAFYMVGYSDYQTRLGGDTLQNVIDGQLKNLKGKITSDKTTTLNGHAGRSAVVDDGANLFFSSVYMAGNRLYQVGHSKR